MRITHIGGPTVLIEHEGWTILSDPTFDPPGRTYGFGLGTSSRKLTGPAVPLAELGPLDVVLVSHDHHADNLDDEGRNSLSAATAVVTNPAAAARLGRGARGIRPGEVAEVTAPGRPPLRIRATPCRHGPPLSRRLVGPVIGFEIATRADRSDVWITGDTVSYRSVRRAALAMAVDVAIVHLGEVRFPVTGPVRYSLTARQGFELGRLSGAESIIPVHYEGWSHFHEPVVELERAMASAPADLAARIEVLPIGTPTSIAV